VALNAKIAHSDAQALYDAAEAILARRMADFEANGVVVSRLLTLMSNHAFSYEPVFNWLDSWLPQHRRAAEPSHLAKFTSRRRTRWRRPRRGGSQGTGRALRPHGRGVEPDWQDLCLPAFAEARNPRAVEGAQSTSSTPMAG
jgi:hypothetical protein